MQKNCDKVSIFMKKTLTIIAAGLLALTASCTYYTNSGNSNYSSKGGYVPIVQPAPVVVQPVVRSVYYTPVIEPPIVRRTYIYTYTPFGVFSE